MPFMPTSDTELDYLAPDFDPSSITIPRLREILVAHNVHYPSSAKKPQLIETFNENIVPKAEKILRLHKKIKRTSRGITDISSSQEDIVTGDDNAGLMPPPPAPSTATATPRRKASRKSTRLPFASSEESAEDGSAPSPSPTKKTPGRRSSSKQARASDPEPGIEVDSKRPPVRRTRRSEVATDVKLGDPESTVKSEAGDESVFSHDNPFQSGSSPLLDTVRSPSGERKRKSLGASVANKENLKGKSSSSRRNTSAFPSVKAEDGIAMPTIKAETPILRLTRKVKPKQEPNEADSILAGEEFTPEEQLELAKEREANGQSAVEPYRPMRRKSGGVSKSAPWVILLTLLGGYATWWRREKLETGYCGLGHRSTAVSDVRIPDWASVLLPECEPCPQHALCYPYLVASCEPDFVLKPHPLSLGGLVPLPPSCEPDGEKVRKVKQVADRAVEELRDRRAKWECGNLIDEQGKVATALEVNELDLKREVSKKKRKGMSEAEFEELWGGALGEIMGREEVVSGIDGPTGFHALSSTSLARLPFTCALKRSARLALARYRVELVGLILLTSLIAAINRRISALRASNSQVPSLVHNTLYRLADQAAQHGRDPRVAPEPWISMGQLRDDMLRDEFSAKKRDRLWGKVREVVEMNANVRASVREGKHGEVSRVWEWIGATRGLEDVPSESRRVSKRLSYGVGDGSSPVASDGKEGRMLGSKWQEGMLLY
ncbi:hypothetical protein FGG08_002694 [Glutinoglossum americanum]|uniref:Sister chromatid separation protein n=1 Tax=Glutinoglossum americanum TaxID=1670608 RepID=A0A9P8I940_9PEZI|nr:hypothetical protein FGG08_002694 [Glutinoglossum americanum]